MLSSVPAARTTTRALHLHLAAREAVDEVASVGLAGVLVDGELAHDGVGDGGELAGLLGVRQQQIDRACKAIAAQRTPLLADRHVERLAAAMNRCIDSDHGSLSRTKLPSGICGGPSSAPATWKISSTRE